VRTDCGVSAAAPPVAWKLEKFQSAGTAASQWSYWHVQADDNALRFSADKGFCSGFRKLPVIPAPAWAGWQQAGSRRARRKWGASVRAALAAGWQQTSPSEVGSVGEGGTGILSAVLRYPTRGLSRRRAFLIVMPRSRPGRALPGPH
jgi:hypothetical protein